jgi:hypothetical protein
MGELNPIIGERKFIKKPKNITKPMLNPMITKNFSNKFSNSIFNVFNKRNPRGKVRKINPTNGLKNVRLISI